MDPRSKPNAAIHQFLVSGRGAVAVEFAFVRLLTCSSINPNNLILGVVRSLSRSRSSSSFRYSLRAPMRC